MLSSPFVGCSETDEEEEKNKKNEFSIREISRSHIVKILRLREKFFHNEISPPPHTAVSYSLLACYGERMWGEGAKWKKGKACESC